MLDSRAQSGIEYLLMIAGVIVVGAIVVTVITSTATSPGLIDPITCRQQITEAVCIATEGCAPYYMEDGTTFYYCDVAQGTGEKAVPGPEKPEPTDTKPIKPVPPQCTTDSDCSMEYLCCSGSCRYAVCAGDRDCGEGLICQNLGTCEAQCVQPPENVIMACQTITESGEYIVGQSISAVGDCITIAANDVSLDCQYKTITGTGASGIGIYSSGYSGITVENCRVTGFNRGIHLNEVSSSILRNNTANSNEGEGIYVKSSTGITILGNEANYNGSTGIHFNDSWGGMVFSENRACDNEGRYDLRCDTPHNGTKTNYADNFYGCSVNVRAGDCNSLATEAYVKVAIGDNVLYLAHNEEYPFDQRETDMLDNYWISSFDTKISTNPAVETISRITVKNFIHQWSEENPLWSTYDSLTQAGRDAVAAGDNIARFLQGQYAEAPGFDFVNLRFNGFVHDSDTTIFKVGNGSFTYTDYDKTERTIPFYIKLDYPANVVTGGDAIENYFDIDRQRIYYRCASNDYTIPIRNGDWLNGDQIIITHPSPTIWYLQTDDYSIPMNSSGGSITDRVKLSSVDYTFDHFQSDTETVYLISDGNCQFSNESFYFPSYLRVNGKTPLRNTIYYDDDNSSRGPMHLPIDIIGNRLFDTYQYRLLTDMTDQDGSVYLLLDASSPNRGGDFPGINMRLMGMDTKESLFAHDKDFYLPDKDWAGQDETDNQFLIAHFEIDVNQSDHITAYIDTATGNLLSFPTSVLSNYSHDVNFFSYGLKLSNDTVRSSNYQAFWSDNGAKVELTDGMQTVTVTVPENPLYLSMLVEGDWGQRTFEGSDYPMRSAGIGGTHRNKEFIEVIALRNHSSNYRYNATTYSMHLNESIGLNVDAAFDPDRDVKDLVCYISHIDFNYVLDLGNGIPAYESVSVPTTKFTNGNNDHVIIPLFGKDYLVESIDLERTPKEIILLNPTGRESYSEGQTITGLKGRGAYAGQTLSLKVGSIIEASGSGDYTARFDLYDQSGQLVAFEEANDGDNLAYVMLAGGEYVLETDVYVESISVVGGGPISELRLLTPGDRITGLLGAGAYAGQVMSVGFGTITIPGNPGLYSVDAMLYNSQEQLVDTDRADVGVNLKDLFLDCRVDCNSTTDYALATSVDILNISWDSNTSEGLIEVQITY